MTCIPLTDRLGKVTGFLCVGGKTIEIRHRGKDYRFEWTEASGWMPVNKDWSERLSPVFRAVWDKLDDIPRPRRY